MESRMTYSLTVYLSVEHIDGEDFDHWKFNTLTEAIDWLHDYPSITHSWTLSSEPVCVPESEYTLWEDTLIKPELTKNSSFNREDK